MSQATPQRTPSYARTAAAASPRSPPAPAPSFTRQLSTASSAAGSSAGSTAADRKKRSHRLRDYYGLGKGAAPSRHPDGLDLDNPATFDPTAYFQELASNASLPDLLRRENELLNEIRELDGERQSLVYNHHHELIDASDTIRKMKSRAEALDTSLDSLKTSFESISQLSASLSTVSTRSAVAGSPTSQSGALPQPAADPRREDKAVRAASPAPQSPTAPRRRSSRSDSVTSPASSRRRRSTSSANHAASPGRPAPSAPGPQSSVPAFSPLVHLSALLALPIVLEALLAARADQQQRAKADALWGTWEPALRSWDEAGVEGAGEVAAECREVLRAAAQRRGGGSAVQSPV
ncbi:hypothetical protein JCM8202_004789 [Rhodotorula sphaerocarpa]